MAHHLEIDMCAGSQIRDTQGEMLSVEGADISELQAGRGRINDNHGKGFFNTVGRVISAKKIFKAEDCDDARQTYYWEKVKSPYIYVKAELFDDEDHQNAKAAAAILRNIHKNDTPLKLKASVEGGVVSRGLKDESLLAQTKIHSIALTFTPANQATLVEPLNLDKSMHNAESDMILIRSVMHLAQADVPSFRHITRVASAEKIKRNINLIQNIIKNVDNEEELDKALKEALAGVAMAGALAGQPAEAKMPAQPKPHVQQQQKPVSHVSLIQGLKTKNPNLWAIAQHESSGGKDLAHHTMDHGMHEGHTAGGPWAMMPNTVSYVFKTNHRLARKYPDLAKQVADPKANHQSITDALNKDPKLAYELANSLYNRISKKYGNNPDKIFHSWYYGLNSKLKTDPEGYVEKVKRNIASEPQKDQVNKALTAGYAGAGRPTAMTGGSVLQTERMADGRGNFKYITCDTCGHEQIYAKNQVKCRNPDCQKSMSLAKLYSIMKDK